VRFAGVEAKGKDGTQHDAQSLGWSSDDGRASAAVARVASTNGDAYGVTQGLSFAFDNLDAMRFSAGVATDRGTSVSDASQANYSFYDFLLHGDSSEFEMRWNSTGPQYSATDGDAPAPGTNGLTLSASHDFGSVSVDAKANRYRDDLGNLADADARASITAALGSSITLGVNAAANAGTQYASLPYAQSGASLQYASGGRQAALSYDEDHYDGGIARDLAVSGAFSVPVLGTVQLSHRQTSTFGSLASTEPGESTAASLLHRLKNGSVSLGYQYAGGAANITFAFDDRLPIGLLRATYYNPNTRFSAPNFSLKLLAL
jgi:hypothetical protein